MKKRARATPEDDFILREPPRNVRIAVIAGLLAVFTALAWSNAVTTSATVDEPIHIVTGYSYLTSGDFRLNPEHPPLVKLLAAVPVLALRPWPSRFDDPSSQDQFDAVKAIRHSQLDWDAALIDASAQQRLGHRFLYGFRDSAFHRYGANNILQMPTDIRYHRGDFLNDADRIVRVSRAVALLFAIALGILIYGWSARLWGFWGALIALALFVFDPNFIGHAALVTTDVAAATLAFGTIYLLWRWRATRSLRHAALAGIALGLALLTKFSTVLLVPILLLVAIGDYLASRKSEERPRLSSTKLVAISAALAFVLVWAGYGFRFSAVRDVDRAREAEMRLREAAASRELDFAVPSRRFSPPGTFPIADTVRIEAAQREVLRTNPEYRHDLVANYLEFAPVGLVGRSVLLMNRLHVLPEAYLHGFALARRWSVVRDSFLRGEHSVTGFRSYFFWTALLKLPIVTLATLLIAIVVAWRLRKKRRADLVLLVLPVVVFGVVLIFSNLNIGHRHSLPIYPFLYTLAGCIATTLTSRRARIVVTVGAFLLALSAFVVLAPPWRPQIVFPHHLSYFNELAGGPRGGYRFLVDSNLDWGQDLPALRHWVERQSLRGPFNLNFFGTADPRYYSIPHKNLRGGFLYENAEPLSSAIRPAYLVISATNVHGVVYTEEARQEWREFLAGLELVDRISYSLLVYRLN